MIEMVERENLATYIGLVSELVNLGGGPEPKVTIGRLFDVVGRLGYLQRLMKH